MAPTSHDPAHRGAAGRPGADHQPALTAPLQATLNATGVVLHPNLGRAPLSAAARQALLDAAGYTAIEVQRDTGRHEPRTRGVGALAARLFNAPRATVVNNGAAALVLVLHALSAGREVVVSRGELVEIGRTYRLPELIATTPARLVEVGTANRTRLDDYRAAVHRDTGLLLKVHRPTQHRTGQSEETPLPRLAALAADRGIPLVHHLGTGLPHALDGPLVTEPTVDGSFAAGADLVLMSGDKLLGGPQAGIIVGREDLIERCEHHPLARAVRIDKLQRAALEATLWSWLRSDLPVDLPVMAMLTADPVALQQRAVWLAGEVGDDASVVRATARIGGSVLPGVELPSWAVRLPSRDPQVLADRLLAAEPPLLVRVDGDAILLDLRTLPPSQDLDVVDALRAGLAG